MSIISRASLRKTLLETNNNPFYGKVTSVSTITNEYIMDKFDGVNHPNSGIEVKFEYFNNPVNYVISANKYSFDDLGDGIFRVCIDSSRYSFELTVTVNENNDIDFDKGVFVNIYDLEDEDGITLAKITIEDAKLVD